MKNFNAKRRAAEAAVSERRDVGKHVKVVDVREKVRQHLSMKGRPCVD
jgi:hypothetical protein